MNWEQFFDGLNLHDDLALDYQIKPIAAVKPYFFVSDWERLLFFNSEAQLPEFNHQACFVRGFQKAWPEIPMNLDCGAYNATRDLIKPIYLLHFSAFSASRR